MKSKVETAGSVSKESPALTAAVLFQLGEALLEAAETAVRYLPELCQEAGLDQEDEDWIHQLRIAAKHYRLALS